MSQTTLNVRMDEDLKRGLETFCNEVGLNVSVAVNMFAKAVVREQRLPFDVAIKPARIKMRSLADMSEAELAAEIQKGLDDVATGRVYSSAEARKRLKRELTL